MSRFFVGVDPGPAECAVVEVDFSSPACPGGPRPPRLQRAYSWSQSHQHCYSAVTSSIWIERIVPYGFSVGQETFDTCVTLGRFLAAVEHRAHREFGPFARLVRRHSVVSEILGGKPKGADAMLRAHLIGVFGPVGTKKNPGPLWPLKELGSHGFAALAVAYYGYLGRGIQGHDWWRFNFETGRCE